MTFEEEWRSVVGFEGYYEVSNLGQVRSVRRNLVLSQYGGGRYPSVRLKVNGVGKTQWVHRLVAAAFLGPKPDLGEQVDICHNDNNPFNNAVTNLRYDTHRNNLLQMVEDGRGNIARTHCKRGHEFTPENTWLHSNGRAGGRVRVCRACHYARRAAS